MGIPNILVVTGYFSQRFEEETNWNIMRYEDEESRNLLIFLAFLEEKRKYILRGERERERERGQCSSFDYFWFCKLIT